MYILDYAPLIYSSVRSNAIFSPNHVPFFSSRPSPQMYVMCVLDYEFHVLDNAFLVHRPGIKRHRRDRQRDLLTAKQNSLLHNKITPELHTIYGKRSTCFL